MPASKKTLFVLAPLLLAVSYIVASTTPHNAYADDPCKKISDLDDRAKCYEEQIEKNEKKYESTSKKLSDVRSQKDSVTGKISQLLGSLSVKQSELNAIQNEIDEMNSALEQINGTLAEKRDSLGEKVSFRNKVIRNYTKQGILNDFELFADAISHTSMNGFQYASLNYMFEKSLNLESKRIIGVLNSEIETYEADKTEAEALKTELEGAQSQLLAAAAQLESQKKLAQGDLNVLATQEQGYEKELKSLQEKINELSSKQQSILKEKYGDSYGSVGDYDAPSAKVPDPPFKPAIAAFSYGAFTHNRGMSQYGAKGRAESGQNYKDIIKFYYKKDVKKKDDFPKKLKVDGHGELDFQYYLYGLAEMPSSWPTDALKAQAIAARTYAYRYVKAGKSICTTESCQVFSKSKAQSPPSAWKKAVDDTKNMIIDGDTHAMYSSTTGGYIDDGVGWDVSGKWPDGAYEKKAKSPWFYWAWYTKSYSFSSDTCGHPHPWLTPGEMADILNSWVVWDKGTSKDRDYIEPLTTSCWGSNPYSKDKMKDKANQYGTAYNTVSDVKVEIGNNGRTTKVILKTDKGTVEVPGDAFKTVFNLRAPARIAIRSRLYDFQVKK